MAKHRILGRMESLNSCPVGNGPGVKEGSRSERTKRDVVKEPTQPRNSRHMERGRVWDIVHTRCRE